MQYSVYPISMSMFNQKLESCQSVKDISENFKFIVTNNTPLILSVFIKSTGYLILSFEDLNFKNWGFFLKKIVQIFPVNQGNLELNWLEKNILIKFREIYPQLALTGKGPIEKKDPNLEVDVALSQVSDVYTISLEKRIENAFNIEGAYSDEDKARILQLNMNFWHGSK
ncbi:MAG: hypothetical protein H0T62_07690 [Parachlamydiaceae bacterium]|nr:hypothetical protein [Parachlamydiaceae bacterium]